MSSWQPSRVRRAAESITCLAWAIVVIFLLALAHSWAVDDMAGAEKVNTHNMNGALRHSARDIERGL